MKRLIYCLIIVMSTSLAFSGGKPCCNKKVGKNVVTCKLNHTDLVIDKDISKKLITTGNSERPPKACKSTTTDGSKCAKKSWWKFWVKNSTKNCACKQAVATEGASEG